MDTGLRSEHGARTLGESGRAAQAVNAAAAPLIFVTGASRSGTTMVARMLGAHSAVLALNEIHYFGDLCEPVLASSRLADPQLTQLAARIIARQERGLWSGRPSSEELERAQGLCDTMPAGDRTGAGVFAAVLSGLAADAGKRMACEQTPRNIFYSDRLLSMYPNARIVHIVRDPRAVLASQKNRWRLRRLGASHLPRTEMLRNRVNYHPYTMSRLWRSATAEALRLSGHPRFLMLRFEDLAAEPQDGVRRICRFLGLSAEPGMLELPRWGSSNVVHTTEETGISREVVDRWREILSRGEALICERVNRDLMQRLCYHSKRTALPGRLALLPSLLTYPLHAMGVFALNPGRAWVQLRAVMKLTAGSSTR